VAFETDKYKFKVYKLTEPGVENIVQIDITFKPRRNLLDSQVAESAVNEVAEMFKTIGKWEEIIKAGILLLEDLGLRETRD